MNTFTNGDEMKRQQTTNKPRPMGVRGALDRGGNGLNSHIAPHYGDVLAVATEDVVTVPPTTPIMTTVRTMLEHGFRRIPIADAGTQQLKGIIVCKDIVDFLCGGPRHLLVTNRFDGNLLAAVNEEIRAIMTTEVPYLDMNASISDALKLMQEESVGCLPIIGEAKRVSAIVTEQDFMRLIANVKVGVAIEEYMSTNVTTVEPDVAIGAAGKLMVDNKFRRLPIVKNGILLGIATAFDMLRFLGSGEALKNGANGIEDTLATPVKSLITRDVIWTTSDCDLGEVAGMMDANNVGSIPIIDQGVLTGIVTERDIVRALAALKQ